ncbi:hypothetical protein GCM10009847_08880 [Leucobacter tardus]
MHVAGLADGRTGVILDQTAFHPVDTAWPDQPADRGTLHFDGTEAAVVDAVIGAVHDGALYVGSDVPVRTGTADWTFTVVHVIAEEGPAVGTEVRVEVDTEYRRALSAGHTACHLASLALDAALTDAWTKTVPLDALGAPAFDALAIQTSRIHPDGSVDTYRVGKSLRKKGFDTSAFDDLAPIEQLANAQLADWVASAATVRIDRDDEAITARRRWVCELPDSGASIPCGGTHVSSLSELGSVTVSLSTQSVTGGIELEMRTTIS